MNKAIPFIIITCFILGIITSVLLLGKNFRNYNTQDINFPNKKKDNIDGILYFPAENGVAKKGKYPALISIHYGLQNREALMPTAKMTAENNIIVLDLILKKSRNIDGKTKDFEDYISDVQGAVEYLKNHNQVDSQRIFISGHSIGGNIAAIVGDGNRDVVGVIAIGYPVSFSPDAKQDLLITSGVFDELHPYKKMETAFKETVNKETNNAVLINPREIEKKFNRDKTNRLFLVSFLSDHYVEPTDPIIAEGCISFIDSMSEKLNTEKLVRKNGIVAFIITLLSRLFLFLSVFFTYSLGLILLREKKKFIEKIPPVLKDRLPVILFIIITVIIGFIHKSTQHLIDIYILSGMLLSVIVVNHFHHKMNNRSIASESPKEKSLTVFFQDLIKVSIFICIFYFSYILGLFFRSGLFPYSGISHIWRSLTGIIFLVISQFYVFCTRINGLFLNPNWTFNFISPVLWGIIAVELVYPGIIGLVIDNFFSRLIKALQNLKFEIKFKINIPGAVLLIVVVIINIIFWKQILAEGYSLGSSEMLGLLKLLFSFILLPATILTILLRWEKIRKLIDSFSYKK